MRRMRRMRVTKPSRSRSAIAVTTDCLQHMARWARPSRLGNTRPYFSVRYSSAPNTDSAVRAITPRCRPLSLATHERRVSIRNFHISRTRSLRSSVTNGCDGMTTLIRHSGGRIAHTATGDVVSQTTFVGGKDSSLGPALSSPAEWSRRSLGTKKSVKRYMIIARARAKQATPGARRR